MKDNYTERLVEDYTDQIYRHDLYFTMCLDLLQDWSKDEELKRLTKFFAITDDYRIAVPLLYIDNYKVIGDQRARVEFMKMIDYIIMSKYNRNQTDKYMDSLDRAHLFKSIANIEDRILIALMYLCPKYNFKFNGKDINGINEHYCLFSGFGSNEPDLITDIGSSVSSEITIEIKPEKALLNENDHAADFIIRYNKTDFWIEDPNDWITFFKGQELDSNKPSDNKKLMAIELYNMLSVPHKYR